MQELAQAELEKWCREQRTFALFVYTPMCGTCKLAARMLDVAQEALPQAEIYQINVNGSPGIATHWQITSVPALLLFVDGQLAERHYALHSVGFVFDVLKSIPWR
ncbi:thioredoxin family protein [Brevibacillus sp. TJ4]|uniref:thioredoxin family protein n=1 Tax=Brevibacillus sp. TJ4 TaxID=3234853 RepID=UPI003BA1D55F